MIQSLKVKLIFQVQSVVEELLKCLFRVSIPKKPVSNICFSLKLDILVDHDFYEGIFRHTLMTLKMYVINI